MGVWSAPPFEIPPSRTVRPVGSPLPSWPMNHYSADSQTRRAFLNRCAAIGVSFAGINSLLPKLRGNDSPVEPPRRPYPSHSPDVFFKGDSKAVIERMILPRPKARKLTDEIYVS